MLKKLTYAAVLCAALALGTTTAQAVTIDLSSPQEGTVIYPGDLVELTITVTNDTAKKDIVHVSLEATAAGYSITGVAKLRMKLAPGQVVTETVATVIPADLEVPFPVTGTITGTANGKKSKTTASDSVSATVAPLP